MGTAQIYPFCIQIDLASSGSTVPQETYDIPQIYGNFSQSYLEYQIQAGEGLAPIPSRPFTAPGPPVFNGAGGTGGNSGGSGGTYTGGALNTTVPVSSVLPGAGSSSAAISGQAEASSIPGAYAPTSPGSAIAAASSVVASSAPGVTYPQTDATAAGGPANPSLSPPVGSGLPGPPSAAGPNAYGSPPASGPDTAVPTGNVMGQVADKGVVNGADGAGSAVDKTLPAALSDEGASGLSDTTAAISAATSAVSGAESAAGSSATELAAGADATAVSSNPATSPAATGTSEYASNIQGGRCGSNTWRCGKNADGTLFLEVCGNKDGSGSLG